QSKTNKEDTVNLVKSDFNASCIGYAGNPYAPQYPCRSFRRVIVVDSNEQPKQLIAQISQTLAYGATGGSEGHDVILNILINGINCAAARYAPTPGANPAANATCIKTLASGSYIVEISMASSTNAYANSYINVVGAITTIGG
ncbi:TPA: hypothetical protein ACQQYF_006757, partial [Pseudomonas aeruginosa]